MDFRKESFQGHDLGLRLRDDMETSRYGICLKECPKMDDNVKNWIYANIEWFLAIPLFSLVYFIGKLNGADGSECAVLSLLVCFFSCWGPFIWQLHKRGRCH